MSHFLNKVVDSLGFNKNPNSSTITTLNAKFSIIIINKSSYADYKR